MTDRSYKKIIAIVGPTASGKTTVGVQLAKRFNGEIVSADSRQVFCGLDLGTGKDLSEYGEVKYHMIDICEPEEDFNLFKYLELARAAIEDIFSRGKLPIIVGGTGLYIQALLEGFELKSKFQNPNFKQGVIPAKAGIQSVYIDSGSQATVRNDRYNREQLEKLMVEQLQEILKKIDGEVFEKLSDQKNQHRLIRAIERAQSGEEMTRVKPNWDVLQIAIDLPRETLNQRIDKRADDRFKQGMLREIENLIDSGVDANWLVGLGLEYRIITEFLISNCSNYSNQAPMTKSQFKELNNSPEFEEMKNLLKLRSHQYAKRQVTWFKRFPEIVWLREYDDIEKKVKEFTELN